MRLALVLHPLLWGIWFCGLVFRSFGSPTLYVILHPEHFLNRPLEILMIQRGGACLFMGFNFSGANDDGFYPGNTNTP